MKLKPLNEEIRPTGCWDVFSAMVLCYESHHQCHLSCLTAGQTASKVLEGSHQQHGFLSITYTQAVTKNVRHKLTTRPERPARSNATTASQRVTADPLADSSPQYLREILLTAQPFDVVLSCPLLATVAGVFQVHYVLYLCSMPVGINNKTEKQYFEIKIPVNRET